MAEAIQNNGIDKIEKCLHPPFRHAHKGRRKEERGMDRYIHISSKLPILQ
jgi:hypothetical protein